jgi:predicted mannosyl-3-phosphoglycerate phosphatase (HAD superfamily)
MNIYVDIDNTITVTNGMDYENATPIIHRIEKINKLYDDGHNITYWTSRGVITKINWEKLTVDQLKIWGAKYHKLLFGKPAFDIFIDDKSFNSETYFK